MFFLLFSLTYFTLDYKYLSLRIEVIDKNHKIGISSSENITINGNFELSQISSSGNGTELNPYVIENLIINGQNNTYCMFIENTDKYFVIENCTLLNASVGLWFYNVTFGNVESSLIHQNLNIGIYLNCSYSCNFYYNNVESNKVSGITLYNSSNNNFVLNNINFNFNNGIILNRSHNNTLSLNLLHNNRNNGLLLNYSDSNDIVGNSIDNHTYAIYLENSNYNLITHNNGKWNNYTIIQVDCEGNILIDNFEDYLEQSYEDFFPIDFTIIFLIIIFVLSCSFLCHKILNFRKKKSQLII